MPCTLPLSFCIASCFAPSVFESQWSCTKDFNCRGLAGQYFEVDPAHCSELVSLDWSLAFAKKLMHRISLSLISSYLISSRSLLLCIEEASLGNSLRGGFLLATEFCWLSLALVSLYLVSLNLTPFLQIHSIHVFGAFTALNLKSGAIPEANPILGFRDLESLVRLKSNITRRARRGAEAVRLVHWVPPQRCPWRTSDPCRVWQSHISQNLTLTKCANQSRFEIMQFQ